jgi:hypothetical protein
MKLVGETELLGEITRQYYVRHNKPNIFLPDIEPGPEPKSQNPNNRSNGQ